MDYPFTTDGCSGGMSWAWKLVTGKPTPWEGACVDHDRAYWEGSKGVRNDGALTRLDADLKLFFRVRNAGYPIIALAMYLAVRVGGHPLLPTPWRWGYGWKFPRGYRG